MLILIVGGLGFIGSHLVEQFKKNHDIIILDNYTKNYPSNRIINRGVFGLHPTTLLEFDYRNKAWRYRQKKYQNIPLIKEWSFNINAITIHRKPDIIINCGAYSEANTSEYFPLFVYKSTILGLKKLKYYFNDVPIIHFSSSMVYGDWTVEMKEGSEINPIGIYAQNKYISELYLDINQDIIVRPMHVYGCGDGKRPIVLQISKYSKKIINSVPIEEADGIYIKDLQKAFRKILDNFVPGVYNLSSGFKRDKECVKSVSKEVLGIDINVNSTLGPVRKQRGKLDNTKFKKVFNWESNYTSYKETVRDYFISYMKYED